MPFRTGHRILRPGFSNRGWGHRNPSPRDLDGRIDASTLRYRCLRGGVSIGHVNGTIGRREAGRMWGPQPREKRGRFWIPLSSPGRFVEGTSRSNTVVCDSETRTAPFNKQPWRFGAPHLACASSCKGQLPCREMLVPKDTMPSRGSPDSSAVPSRLHTMHARKPFNRVARPVAQSGWIQPRLSYSDSIVKRRSRVQSGDVRSR